MGTTTTALATVPQHMGLQETERIAGIFAQSGMFTDAGDMAKAFVKIMAGQAMGFDPFSSMNGIHIISGKPSMGAGLIAAAIARSGKYDFDVIEHTDEVCTIRFMKRRGDKWIEAGVSSFTMADARAAKEYNRKSNTWTPLADKHTWKSYPRNMLYARAMSNGARWYCPDVFGGAIYVPEELGAEVDGDGVVIDMPAEHPAPPPTTKRPSPYKDDAPAKPRKQSPIPVNNDGSDDGPPPLVSRPDLIEAIMEAYGINQTTALTGVRQRLDDGTLDNNMTNERVMDVLVKARRSDDAVDAEIIDDEPADNYDDLLKMYKAREIPLSTSQFAILAERLQKPSMTGDATGAQKGKLAMLITAALPFVPDDEQDAARHMFVGALFGKEGVSALSKAEASALIELLTDAEGNGLHPMTTAEVGEFLSNDDSDDNDAGE